MTMDNVRIYGKAPYRALVLHGGPGAPGCAAGLCRTLEESGISTLEHLQLGRSAEELMREILEILDHFHTERITVVGHSYGAWLALLFAQKHPARVRNVVIIGCGPLEEKYLSQLSQTREARRAQGLHDTDNYCALPHASGDMLYFDKEQHISLMEEMTAIRKSGELLRTALSVPAKVTAIHGAYDPHPAEALRVLEGKLPGYEMHLLERCGHDPWKETYAREEFIEILVQEIG